MMNEPTVHIRFEGRSVDLPMRSLDLGPASADVHVFEALARHFDISARRFQGYVVERHANGNITVRPEAVFG